MKDYSVLSDFEINKLVAEKEGLDVSGVTKSRNEMIGVIKDFCNTWADMGAIIEREKISIQFRSRGKKEFNPLAKGFGSDSEMAIHENPLRAAAIVYLMMGDEY